jgi:HD-like signal output (HDOD) protein
MLADSLRMGLSDEAFLAGLIHDIGIMVEMQYDRNKLIEVFEKMGDGKGVPTVNMLEVEDGIFGANHQDFGAGVCEKWKFPKTFAAVTGYHHRPMEIAPENRTLVCLVHIADRIAAEVVGGFRHDLLTTEIDPAIRDELKLTAEKLAEIKKALPDQIKNNGSLLG